MEKDNLKTEAEKKGQQNEEGEKRKLPFKVKARMFIYLTFFAIIWIFFVQYIAADKYEVKVAVKNDRSIIGINPREDSLDYGDMPKNNSAIRYITVKNDGKMKVYVKMFRYGEITELIKESDSGFILNSGEDKKIEFLLTVPSSAEEKTYNGRIIIFKTPLIF